MARKQMSAKTEIVGCRFSGNSALIHGGAIEFRESGKVDVINSTFIENSVKDHPTWRFADAGAIYFGCKPDLSEGKECEVVLDQNVFERNTALNKGGAMRYINQNFTSVFQHRQTGRRIL